VLGLIPFQFFSTLQTDIQLCRQGTSTITVPSWFVRIPFGMPVHHSFAETDWEVRRSAAAAAAVRADKRLNSDLLQNLGGRTELRQGLLEQFDQGTRSMTVL
jgi:hypothetical protein